MSAVAANPGPLMPRLFVALGDERSKQLLAGICDGRSIVILSAQVNSEADLKCKVDEGEKYRSKRTILFYGGFEGLDVYARDVGYALFVLPKGKTDEVIAAFDKKFSSVPVRKDQLPKMLPWKEEAFFNLLNVVDQIFEKAKITYWATCGTLLGVVRHGTMIPWDDDLDIAVFQDDVVKLTGSRPKLKAAGLKLFLYEELGYYKIYLELGSAIPVKSQKTGKPQIDPKTREPKYYDWKFPFLDVFVYKDAPETDSEGSSWHSYVSEACQKRFPKDRYKAEELNPLSPVPVTFGNKQIQIRIPHSPKAILSRMYGPDWERVAYAEYNHESEQLLERVKVDL